MGEGKPSLARLEPAEGGNGEAGEMVEGKPSLARLEPAEGGHVDARVTRHVLERQAALDPQFAQPAPNSQVNIILNSCVCLHGKLHWQIQVRTASWRHERNE